MVKIILFGDSITAGYEEGLTDFRLNEKIEAVFDEIEVINAGIPGNTTKEALERVERHVLRYVPDLVTVFFGANDVSLTSGMSLEAYKKNMLALIERIGSDKMILIGTPYASQRFYATERPLERLKEFSDCVRVISLEQGISYIDLLEAMLADQPESYLQRDGLHFSEAGYELLARLINEEIRKKKEG